LSIPGEVAVHEAGCVVSASYATAGNIADLGNDAALIAARRCPGLLAVRSRKPGDRFRPLGLGGSKKLQDFFVDRGVARQMRDRVPLVVDAEDRIVWVGGHAIDEAYRVTEPAEAVIILRLNVLGGPA
jgi:tRNA(Ile)-lysidine synthetase-like protein